MSPWTSRRIALVSLVWLVFAAADTVLMLSPPSVRVLGDFSLLDRTTLVASELTALLLFSAVLAVPVEAMWRVWGRTTNKGRSRAGLTAGLLAGGAAGALFAGSWIAFLVTGAFLNGTGLRLWLAGPVQTARHGLGMAPVLTGSIPLFFLLGAFVLGYDLPRRGRALAEGPRRALNRKAALLASSLVVLFLLGLVRGHAGTAEISDPQADRVYSAADRYRLVRAERTGPAAGFLAGLWRELGGGAHGLPASDAIEPGWDPILSLEDYTSPLGVARPEKPDGSDVFVILVESLRPDVLESYGGQRQVMPNVDSLAGEARVFLDAYAQSSHSNYADLPPLSSHYPLRSSRMHVYPEDPPYPRVLVYDVLKSFGYRTAIFSSQNEHWGGMANYLVTGNLDRFFHSETHEGPTYVPATDSGFAKYARNADRAGKLDDSVTVDAAIEWVREQEDPLFVYMNLQNSHAPYRTPDGFPRRFGPAEIDFELGFGVFPPEKVEVVRDLYANSLAYVDHQLGRLFEALEDAGRWDDAVIVLTGDTGQAFLEHGFAAHAGPLFDEVTRVPLIVRAPGHAAARDSSPAEHVDVPPTLLDLLGLPPHPGFQGTSLLGPSVPSNGGRYLVAQSPLAHQYAVVADGWKLIRDVRRGATSLFDLDEDPEESVDLAERAPDRRQELERQLGTWIEVQLDYYGAPALFDEWYPPKLVPVGGR